MLRPLRALVLLLLLGPLAACATLENPWGQDATVSIAVDNRGTTRAATIFLMERSGVRQYLGRVRTDETAEFRVQPRQVEYRLVAEFGGSDMVSRAFTVRGGDRWTWRIDQNRLSYQGERGS